MPLIYLEHLDIAGAFDFFLKILGGDLIIMQLNFQLSVEVCPPDPLRPPSHVAAP